MSSLTERRAIFVYEAARIAASAALAPIIPEPWEVREDAFRAQFMEVIERQMGPMRSESPEELHGSWVQAYIDMGWKYGPERDPEKKTHPDMIPYAGLEQLEQDKDAVFVALCEIARRWVYDIPDKLTRKRGHVIDDLLRERQRQDSMWGGPTHDDEHPLVEWVGLISNRVSALTNPHPAERELLLEIAALAVARIESFDRQQSREEQR